MLNININYQDLIWKKLSKMIFSQPKGVLINDRKCKRKIERGENIRSETERKKKEI